MQRTVVSTGPLVTWGVAARALPGQAVSGDLHLVKSFADRVLIAALDGIGHGEEAAAAARTAVDTLEKHVGQSPDALVKLCQAALIKTRGAALTVASVDGRTGTLAWLGVGSVEARLLRAEPRPGADPERVILRGGVVGYQIPELRVSTLPIAAGDMLIFTTDGVAPGLQKEWAREDSPEQIASRIMEQNFKGTDDALVLVVRYLGMNHE